MPFDKDEYSTRYGTAQILRDFKAGRIELNPAIDQMVEHFNMMEQMKEDGK